MYPLAEGQTYPYNQWWIAATSAEVGRSLLERTILERDVLFYRTEAGEPVAVSARCPHRLFPLVRGRLVGDSIQCGYHGFTFGCDGQCSRIPGQERIPASMKLHSYPVADHMGWVWIWMGDPDRANRHDLPTPPCLGEPGHEVFISGRQHLNARYTLLIDNLMDLTHVPYVHAAYVSNEKGELPDGFDAPVELSQTKEIALRAQRHHRNAHYDGYATLLFGPSTGLMAFDTLSDYHGPALIVTGSVHYLNREQVGKHAPDMGDPARGVMRNIHGITPETRFTTHYFGGHIRNFRRADSAFTATYHELDRLIRVQDVEVLEAIEPVARTARTDHEQSAAQDAGAIRVRRLLAQQIDADGIA